MMKKRIAALTAILATLCLLADCGRPENGVSRNINVNGAENLTAEATPEDGSAEAVTGIPAPAETVEKRTTSPSTTAASTTQPTTALPKTTTPTTAVTTTTIPSTAAPTTAPPTTTAQTRAAQTTMAPTTTVPAPSSGELSYPIRYDDNGVKITIEKQWYLGTCCYIAHVQLSDYSRLKTGLAEDNYGSDELPAAFAASHNGLLTINGDYAEGDGKGVLRRGTIYGSAGQIPDAAYSQESGRFTAADGATIAALAEAGYTESFGFGAPVLVRDGKSIYGRKDGGKSTQRTLIGTTGEPGDIYLVVTEGRYTDGASRGLQYYEAGDLLESLGCDYGIALDGGGSSTMVWNGQKLNENIRQEVTGFVYVTGPG